MTSPEQDARVTTVGHVIVASDHYGIACACGAYIGRYGLALYGGDAALLAHHIRTVSTPAAVEGGKPE